MTTKFEITLIAPAKLVGTIVELLNDEGCLVSMRPYVETDTPKKPLHRFHGGKRNKGISAANAVLEALDKNLRIPDSIGNYIASNYGFAPNSASPALSRLLTEGRVHKEPDGSYRRTVKFNTVG